MMSEYTSGRDAATVSGVPAVMTSSGWPQNQQDLRWPYTDAEEAGPGSRAGGRVATDSDRGSNSSASFWVDHPSGPLPVTRDSQRRGRSGRGKSRDGGAPGVGDTVADEDYDWIKYLGEAGPAQEHSRRAGAPPASARPGSGRP